MANTNRVATGITLLTLSVSCMGLFRYSIQIPWTRPDENGHVGELSGAVNYFSPWIYITLSLLAIASIIFTIRSLRS